MVGVGGSWARRQETAPRRAAKAIKAKEFDFMFLASSQVKRWRGLALPGTGGVNAAFAAPKHCRPSQ